ncbi:hypothetical protein JQN72_02525 [Phycicoccus sp. CSK15P-2]|uniref:hypothetical protein n=1 Tax=Phycicoccus sp. CSK15P-2 TaxID=2807627 RepID=UPI00194FF648|nr:hypothetical protein [Phycicoccus sp. CSK15P-2]MBM6403122.1 hypothetical protein [Phycicoccus sp. CSK15P-2]
MDDDASAGEVTYTRSSRHAASTGAESETRAARRARREAQLRNPVLPAMATVTRPAVVVTTVVLTGLLVAGLRVDPVILAGGLAWTGLLLAFGWPRLLGSSSRFGSSLAIGVAGVLTPVSAVVPDGTASLAVVPVALTIGLALMFGHQIVRTDGRPRLTESVGVTSLGIALVAVGATWLPLTSGHRTAALAVAGLVGVGAASLADLAVGMRPLRPWLLPLAMVLGASGALVSAGIVGGPRPAAAALAGMLVGAVSHALRRVLCVLPPVTSLRGQLASAAAGVLVGGVVAYGVALALVG